MPAFPTTLFTNDVLNLIKNNTPHLALYTVAPTAAGGGTEVSGGSYARKPITYGAIAAGQMSNSALISYSGLPASTITHYGVFSAATGGTLKAFGSLNAPVSVISGDQLQFPVGNHTLTFAGS